MEASQRQSDNESMQSKRSNQSMKSRRSSQHPSQQMMGKSNQALQRNQTSENMKKDSVQMIQDSSKSQIEGTEQSSRGASVFDEVEVKLQEMWKEFYESQKNESTKPSKKYEPSQQELREEKLELAKAKSELDKRRKRKKDFNMNIRNLSEKSRRKWLCNRGKKDRLKFSDDQIFELKRCFDSLDDDGGGSIGIEELQEPLIGLGFADTLEEVQALVDAVDEDRSGMIEFDEFLNIIENSEKSEATRDITVFFKKLTAGEFDMEDISFSLFVQRERRKHMMDSIVASKGSDEHKKGRRIKENLQKQMDQEKEEALNGNQKEEK